MNKDKNCPSLAGNCPPWCNLGAQFLPYNIKSVQKLAEKILGRLPMAVSKSSFMLDDIFSREILYFMNDAALINKYKIQTVIKW